MPIVYLSHVRIPPTVANPELIQMRNSLSDFIYAVRGLRRRPGLAALAVLTLAMGIGLTTAMFGITNGLLLNGCMISSSSTKRMQGFADIDFNELA